MGLPEALAAAGLLIGLWWTPLGVAAAVGVELLMVGAIGLHLRAHLLGVPLIPPIGVLTLAVAVASFATSPPDLASAKAGEFLGQTHARRAR